jgi:hypothetical protein
VFIWLMGNAERPPCGQVDSFAIFHLHFGVLRMLSGCGIETGRFASTPNLAAFYRSVGRMHHARSPRMSDSFTAVDGIGGESFFGPHTATPTCHPACCLAPCRRRRTDRRGPGAAPARGRPALSTPVQFGEKKFKPVRSRACVYARQRGEGLAQDGGDWLIT